MSLFTIKKDFDANLQGVGSTLDFVEQTLLSYNLSRRHVNSAILSVEETLVRLVENAEENTLITCSIKRLFGSIKIKILSRGKKINLGETLDTGTDTLVRDFGSEAEDSIRDMILKKLSRNIKYKYRNNISTLSVEVGHEENAFAFYTLLALGLAIVYGIFSKVWFPPEVIQSIDTYILNPVETMFLNALGFVSAPCLFVGMVLCATYFKNYIEFGTIGTKVIISYCCTTIVAVLVGVFAFFAVTPGKFGLLGFLGKEGAKLQFSYIDMLINVVPPNFVDTFVNGSTLQLMFLGIICGAAILMLDDRSQYLTKLFESLDGLITNIFLIIIKVFPIAIFCTMARMIINNGFDMLISIGEMMATVILGIILLFLVYSSIIILFGKLNPLPFWRKYSPNLIPTFSSGSYGLTMPQIFSTCNNKLGISSKIYSFSLPLGAYINMDGNCVYFTICALFLARLSGITLSPLQTVVLLITVVVLSFGSPGMTGGGIVCLTVILTQLGVPLSAVTVIVSIDALMSQLRRMSNIVGDVAISLSVASMNDMLDKEKYYAK